MALPSATFGLNWNSGLDCNSSASGGIPGIIFCCGTRLSGKDNEGILFISPVMAPGRVEGRLMMLGGIGFWTRMGLFITGGRTIGLLMAGGGDGAAGAGVAAVFEELEQSTRFA
jgi:hypothetical protein